MNLDHTIPTRISEILISKICHDLVSPVGAGITGLNFSMMLVRTACKTAWVD